MTIEEIYNQYHQQVYHYCYGVLQQRQDAEDITAQTFETAYQKFEQTKGYDKQSTWLIQIARNHMSNKFRKKDFVTESEQFNEDMSRGFDQLFSDPDQDLLRQAQEKEVSQRVQELLQELTPLQREAIVLCLWHNMKLPEVAQITGRSLRAVRANYYRGLERLRELLAEQNEDDRFWGVYILSAAYIYKCPEYAYSKTLDSKILSIIKGQKMHPMLQAIQGYLSTQTAAIITGTAITASTFTGAYLVMNTGSKPQDQVAISSSLSQSLSDGLSGALSADQLTWSSKKYTLYSNINNNEQNLELTLQVPQDSTSEIISNNGNDELKLQSDLYKLNLVNAYESFPSPITTDYQEVGLHPEFGQINRVLEANSTWRYTSKLEESEFCYQLTDENTTICAHRTLASDNQNLYLLNVTCQANLQNVGICDQMVLSISGQSKPLSQEDWVTSNLNILSYTDQASIFEDGIILIPHPTDVPVNIETNYTPDTYQQSGEVPVDLYSKATFDLAGGQVIIEQIIMAGMGGPDIYSIDNNQDATVLTHQTGDQLVRYRYKNNYNGNDSEDRYGFTSIIHEQTSQTGLSCTGMMTGEVKPPCYAERSLHPLLPGATFFEIKIKKTATSEQRAKILEIADYMATHIYYQFVDNIQIGSPGPCAQEDIFLVSNHNYQICYPRFNNEKQISPRFGQDGNNNVSIEASDLVTFVDWQSTDITGIFSIYAENLGQTTFPHIPQEYQPDFTGFSSLQERINKHRQYNAPQAEVISEVVKVDSGYFRYTLRTKTITNAYHKFELVKPTEFTVHAYQKGNYHYIVVLETNNSEFGQMLDSFGLI